MGSMQLTPESVNEDDFNGEIHMQSGNQPINIVRCNLQNQKHFSKLEDAYFNLFNENENLKFLSLCDLPFDSNTISAFLKNASAEEVEYYVAISVDNNIVGISIFESDLIKGFQVIGIVVDYNYRYKGIGKALINKGIEFAHEKGFKAIDISVFADNKAMLILLIKMDFKITKIEYHARYDGEDLIHLKRHP